MSSLDPKIEIVIFNHFSGLENLFAFEESEGFKTIFAKCVGFGVFYFPEVD